MIEWYSGLVSGTCFVGYSFPSSFLESCALELAFRAPGSGEALSSSLCMASTTNTPVDGGGLVHYNVSQGPQRQPVVHVLVSIRAQGWHHSIDRKPV